MDALKFYARAAFIVGAACMTGALEWSGAVQLGLWWLLFWFGAGLVWAAQKDL